MARDAGRGPGQPGHPLEQWTSARQPRGQRSCPDQPADIAHVERIHRGRRVRLSGVGAQERCHQPCRADAITGGVTEVQEQRVSGWVVREHDRKRWGLLKRRTVAEQLLARPGKTRVVRAAADPQRNLVELVDDLPVVADICRRGGPQARASQRMRSEARRDRVAQPAFVQAARHTDLEMHAPWLVLPVQVQVELIENVQLS
jgi:hypothetical protein